jgi:putative transcriptional regulator
LKNIVRELREKKGLTQQEVADIMGVSRQTINSLETGKYNPSILLAHKIAKFFALAIEEVFIFEEE